VNSWTGEDDKGRSVGLAGLIRALDKHCRADGLERIRYTTSHPNDMEDDLIAAHGEVDILMPYLHLPVQSGNDRVLKAMNRAHTAESYLRLLERFDEVRYSQAFSFKYSPRPGTPAATMDNQIAKEVMDDRLQRLQARLNRDQFAFNKALAGKTCSVLVERKGKLEGQWLGKAPWLTSVWFKGEAEIGDIVEVSLVDAGPNSIEGRLV
jgi:tRNA-2-methylthio-N6-dimethylallyladenosine synthase